MRPCLAPAGRSGATARSPSRPAPQRPQRPFCSPTLDPSPPCLQVRRMQNQVRRVRQGESCMDQAKVALTPLYELPGLKVGSLAPFESRSLAVIGRHCNPWDSKPHAAVPHALLIPPRSCRTIPATAPWLCWQMRRPRRRSSQKRLPPSWALILSPSLSPKSQRQMQPPATLQQPRSPAASRWMVGCSMSGRRRRGREAQRSRPPGLGPALPSPFHPSTCERRERRCAPAWPACRRQRQVREVGTSRAAEQLRCGSASCIPWPASAALSVLIALAAGPANSSFAQRQGSALFLDGAPFSFVGFNAPGLAQWAFRDWPGDQDAVDALLREAARC